MGLVACGKGKGGDDKAATMDMEISSKCFKTPMGMGLQVGQVLFDAVKELEAAAPAADGSAAAGSAAAPAPLLVPRSNRQPRQARTA